MSNFYIEGGYRMEGEISVQGAKNAVLPILVATVLNSGKNVIHNCPKLRDVKKTVEVLRSLGCKVVPLGDSIVVDSSCMYKFTIEEHLMRQMRSSINFLGAIIARAGEAVVSMPGGCEIGIRPIDLHLKALRKLGITITEERGYIICKGKKIVGCPIHLDFPSVGATENIMLASVMAEGTTILTNAAREPEIVDLQNFLNRMGAKVIGAGTDTIRIDGVKKLYGVDYSIMPDRIAAGTYLACCCASGGELLLKDTNCADMISTISLMREMGSKIICDKDSIALVAPKRLKSFGSVRTMPYPGFPTDIQSPFLALASIADGTSMICETIFENRFQNADELRRMGANITIDGKTAIIIGVKRLYGANVVAKELRGGASLVIAALGAEGETNIENIEYIDRGYESMEEKLSNCGLKIQRVNVD